jgi:dynein heavy chain
MNVQQLSELIALIITDLGALERKIIVALVTTDVHARDVIEELKEANVSSTYDFMWLRQLRYIWDEDVDDLRIKQVAATLNYGYEYQGATSRLVITPLTDRCWITISNALHIKLGANPAGPAGTGKTESTKDLAKATAIQCIVYNCSD